ncbi:hypothetical protein N0V85_003701 [Neurospora sp. IMI 360204]|nr:hypothetical protein N0V85_003701 [Neurospora sp. IMI 360204]
MAVQIFNEARKFCYRSKLPSCVLYRGGPMREQMEQMAKGCDILVASPGRLIDFMPPPATVGARPPLTATKPRRSTAKKASYVEPQTTTDKDESAASVDYDALDDSPTGHLAKKTRNHSLPQPQLARPEYEEKKKTSELQKPNLSKSQEDHPKQPTEASSAATSRPQGKPSTADNKTKNETQAKSEPAKSGTASSPASSAKPVASLVPTLAKGPAHPTSSKSGPHQDCAAA